METVLTGIDSVVMFRNSQGLSGRGTLVHITRSVVVFEVYNPFSIVQLSEVLHGVRILRGERAIYNGRASVSSIVTTGLMVIVSATLLDPWRDLSELAPGDLLQIETERFVRHWEASQDLRPNYQLIVTSLSSFFAELSRWLNEAETGTFSDEDSDSTESLKKEFYQEVRAPLLPEVFALYEEFENEACKIPPEEVTAHKAFARRELHPVTMCSPFVYRTYTKPLGYAGDYEMVNMMLEESDLEMPNAYANIVHSFHISTAAPEAHRNRIDMLEKRLKEEVKRATGEGRPFTALSVGCGPAIEVERFIRSEPLSTHAVFQLLDFNQETLDSAQSKIQQAIKVSGRRPIVKLVNQSMDDLLKEVHESPKRSHTQYDFVYCAGLFDYFTDHTCRSLTSLFFEWIRPGGLVTVTNVHPCNPNRYGMEHLLEWYLCYRDEESLLALSTSIAEKTVSTDPTGVNVFLDIRKEE